MGNSRNSKSSPSAHCSDLELIKGREGGSISDRSRIQSVLDPFHHWSLWGIRGFRRGYDG
jgi:hypothetical protein